MPNHSIPKGALRVPQRTYAITKLGAGPHALVTKNLLTCMALAGVDKTKGIAFLAHFDTPFTSYDLPRLIDELKQHAAGDTSGFELHEVASFSTWIPAIFLAALPFAWFHSWFAFQVCLVLGGFLSSTRLMFWWQLAKLKRQGLKLGKPRKHRPMRWFNMCGRAMCWVDCDGRFEAARQVHGYEPPDGSFPWLGKPPGSL